MKTTLSLLAASVFALLTSACNDTTDAGASKMSDAKSMAEAAAVAKMEARGLINLNTASEDMLLKIPGLSDDIQIVLNEQRPFASAIAMDAALAKSGVPVAARQGLYKFAFIPFDINTTPEMDFLLIPGLSEKMAHEFVEYRPYSDVAQFNREIGKYVNEAEVARLRQYVTIP